MRSSSLLAICLLAPAAAAQSRAIVSGVVRDSIAGTTLAGASVQLVGVGGAAQFVQTVTSDGLGRFQLIDIPDGRYRIGFYHSRLDSLGIVSSVRDVTVAGQRSVRTDLSTPAAAELRVALCGPSSDSGAIVIGTVRDARDRSTFADAAITADWLEYGLGRAGITFNPMSARAVTRPNGWFALCGLPRAGTIVLAASRGTDSTDRFDVELPSDRFLLRDLYLGPARVIASEDTMTIGDSLVRSPRVNRVGDGRLTGRVVASVGGRPLVGAQVGLVGGPQTRANDNGEWTLLNAAAGTRSLEIRAVGYYPERRTVDVIVDGEPVYVAMRTMRAVLDTVRVVEARFSNRNFAEFERRQRGGAGNYITMADLERQKPLVASDVFRLALGVRKIQSSILVRSLKSEWCVPETFVDGLNVGRIDADEMDNLIDPDEIAGIEVYSGTSVPVQFGTMQRGGDRCGAILIWTKMRTSRKNAWTARNALLMLGFVGLSIVGGVLFTSR